MAIPTEGAVRIPPITAARDRQRLVRTKVMDLSAAKKSPIPLPITPKDSA